MNQISARNESQNYMSRWRSERGGMHSIEKTSGLKRRGGVEGGVMRGGLGTLAPSHGEREYGWKNAVRYFITPASQKYKRYKTLENLQIIFLSFGTALVACLFDRSSRS